MITFIHAAMAKKSEREEGEKGFTLIELLVVILIIGVLAAIAIPVFLGQQASARDNAVQSDIANAKIAVVQHMVKHDGAIPTTAQLTAGLEGFKPAGSSNLSIVSTTTAFCISGYDTANTSSKPFAADDTTGVDKGTCDATTAVVIPGTWT